MWKRIPGIIVPSQTLKSPPNPGNSGKESQEPRVGRVALHRVVPMPGIEAEKELNVLEEG